MKTRILAIMAILFALIGIGMAQTFEVTAQKDSDSREGLLRQYILSNKELLQTIRDKKQTVDQVIGNSARLDSRIAERGKTSRLRKGETDTVSVNIIDLTKSGERLVLKLEKAVRGKKILPTPKAAARNHKRMKPLQPQPAIIKPFIKKDENKAAQSANPFDADVMQPAGTPFNNPAADKYAGMTFEQMDAAIKAEIAQKNADHATVPAIVASLISIKEQIVDTMRATVLIYKKYADDQRRFALPPPNADSSGIPREEGTPWLTYLLIGAGIIALLFLFFLFRAAQKARNRSRKLPLVPAPKMGGTTATPTTVTRPEPASFTGKQDGNSIQIRSIPPTRPHEPYSIQVMRSEIEKNLGQISDYQRELTAAEKELAVMTATLEKTETQKLELEGAIAGLKIKLESAGLSAQELNALGTQKSEAEKRLTHTVAPHFSTLQKELHGKREHLDTLNAEIHKISNTINEKIAYIERSHAGENSVVIELGNLPPPPPGTRTATA